MKVTIKDLVLTDLARLGRTASDHTIKKAYHRNYHHRKKKGLIRKDLVAEQITRYILVNNYVIKNQAA